MDEQANQAIGSPTFLRERGPTAPKKWDDLGIEEKLERLRAVLRASQGGLERVIRGHHEVFDLLLSHAHGADGKPVSPISYGHGTVSGNSSQAYDPLA